MAVVKQDLVVTQKRYVAKLEFAAESGAYNLGVTGSAFDPIGGVTGESFVRGITNNTAALSRVTWTNNLATGGFTIDWDGSTDRTAFAAYGANGDVFFDRLTIRNNAVAPTGIVNITPTASCSGTLILEFVHASGSVMPNGYFSS